jgi:hypothetical protein
MSSETRKWFLAGFAITAILAMVFLGIHQAPTGKAQDNPPGGSSPNRLALQAELEAFPPTITGVEAEQVIASAVADYGPPLVIPAADFVSDGFSPANFRFVVEDASDRGGYVTSNNDPNVCVMAPVYLPNGATMTSFTATVVDKATNARIIVRLYRTNKTTGNPTTLALVSTGLSSSSNSLQDITTTDVSGATINNLDYFYYVTTCLENANIQLYSARVFYAP